MEREIPKINDTFDLELLIEIVKRKLVLSLLILLLATTGAYLYLRYTPRIYSASAIIQINKDEIDEETINKFDDFSSGNSLQNLIELLRSKEFLKRIAAKLPLSVSYFSEGTFLDTEYYKNAPFFVEVKDLPAFLYGATIYINFISDKQYVVNINHDGHIREFTFKTNTWESLFEGKIYLNISDLLRIKQKSDNIKNNRFYIKLYTVEQSITTHMSGLQVSILNQNANTIEIKHLSQNPDKSSDIVNTIAEDFMKFNVEKKQEKADKILRFIEEQLTIVYSNLESAESALKNFKYKHNISNVVRHGLPTNIGNFKEKENNNEQQQNLLDELEYALSNNGPLNTYDMISSFSSSKSEGMIVNFLNAIQQLESEKEKMLINVTANNLNIKVIDKQIENQKKLLGEFIQASKDKLSIVQKINSEKLENKSDPETDYDEIEFSKLQRIYSIHSNYYNGLIERKTHYLISRAGNVTQNLILEKSISPKKYISPNNSQIIVLSLGIALFLIFASVFINYLMHNEINTASDIRQYTNSPILGSIPYIKKAGKYSQLFAENKSTSMFTESLRSIRSNLDFVSNNEANRIIAVSSTISGEGKTFVAINLGAVIAFTGKKVILLDMDLRKPKIHIGFDSDNDKGISTILINKTSYKECIKNTSIPNFHYITAGPIPPNPSEMAMSGSVDQLIEQLKSEYDTIIIDTPPIGIVSDAVFSFQRCDIAIYVAKSNYSKKNFINNINYLVKEKNIKNLGIILNGAKIKQKGYGYGYSYGYGYGHGYYSDDITVKPNFLKKLFHIKNNT